MTIGIDGGALSIADDRLKVGVYRVTRELIRETAKLDKKNNYRVYTFNGGGKGIPEDTPSNISYIPLIRPGFRKIWQPINMLQHKIDAYLGISQAFPTILYDVKKIGFIYDIGFLEHPGFYRESYFSLKRQTADVIRQADHIITISNASADSIRRTYALPKEKLTVAYLGVGDDFTAKGPAYRKRHPYFLFVGSLKPGKNVPMMLRSFARFLSKVSQPYDFILAGSDYWIDPGISATVNGLGLARRVKFAGFVDDETLAGYYRGATAFLSVSRIEGFGLPTAEAMACGCPVIVSTTGSSPEVAGSAGILVDPDDEDTLSRSMYAVATDRVARKTLSEKGIQRAKRYNWMKFTRTVLRIAGALGPTS